MLAISVGVWLVDEIDGTVTIEIWEFWQRMINLESLPSTDVNRNECLGVSIP